jgi:catechol 2,3-dioxygenase-like lactoylglutathione lyase family enzyme
MLRVKCIHEEDEMGDTLPGLTRIDHCGLTIPDLDAALEFYVSVLGGEELYRMGPFDARQIPAMPDGRDWTDAHVNVADASLRFAAVQLGTDFVVELFEYTRPQGVATPPRNNDAGGHHLGLRVSDLDVALEFLRERGVQTFETIEADEGPTAGTRAAYFLDPWGNHLELVERGL